MGFRVTHCELPREQAQASGIICLKPIGGAENQGGEVIIFHSFAQYQQIVSSHGLRDIDHYAQLVRSAPFIESDEEAYHLPHQIAEVLERLIATWPADLKLKPDHSNDFCGSILARNPLDGTWAGLVCLWHKNRPTAWMIHCRRHYYDLFEKFPECFEYDTQLARQREVMERLNFPATATLPPKEFDPITSSTFCQAILMQRTVEQITKGAIITHLPRTKKGKK